MKKYTIEDLSKGICAVVNDGTLEQLKEVIKKAFPNSDQHLAGAFRFYFPPIDINKIWECSDETHQPTQSVKDFLEAEIIKPPLGLKPRLIHDSERKQSIVDAIWRYVESNQDIPIEWMEEYIELCKTKKNDNLDSAKKVADNPPLAFSLKYIESGNLVITKEN